MFPVRALQTGEMLRACVRHTLAAPLVHVVVQDDLRMGVLLLRLLGGPD